jgi:aminomethyltransferase
MGPCLLFLPDADRGLPPPERRMKIAALIERLVPADIQGLAPGRVRYTTLLNAEGGVLDDLMVARPGEAGFEGVLYIVVNAGRKSEDWALIRDRLKGEAELRSADHDVLMALQGPEAAAALAAVLGEAPAALRFMHFRTIVYPRFGGLRITRSGYTGEDGFEILVDARHAEDFARALLAQESVKPIGLGARDSLRLEAGLCLYGHDLDPTISPIEADLGWTIGKRRREAGDFPGAARILRELKEGPARKRIGIRPKDRAPAREGVEIMQDGRLIGIVTSGGFSPTLNAPISMGYVEARFAAPGTRVDLIVRNQRRPAEIVPLPFVPHRYAR